jgi:starch synthase
MKPLKIFYVVSEVAPFAKTGGLADVAGTYPKYLKDLGHDIRVMMPDYRVVNERKYVLRDVIRLRNMEVQIGDRIVAGSAKSAFLPGSKVQVYFLDNREYFDREDLYQDPKTGKDYADNAERFVFFCKECLETLRLLHWQPDVIHCNDWQTALIPVYLKTLLKEDPFFQRTGTLLTIHNAAYQGIFPSDAAKLTGLPPELAAPGGEMEFWGKVNFLKAGILYADLLSTVSPTYAREIQESEQYGCGLEETFRRRSKDLYGIINGVDYTVWNPETDSYIPYPYSLTDVSGKEQNKQALLEQLRLEYQEDVPLIGVISRLADQKGFDLISDSFDELMSEPVQFVLLGCGEKRYETMFRNFAKKYPRKVSVHIKFDEPLAHLIEAGADMFLMPSRYEPCGLNQMYSLKYGTIPIVHATGGLADTVQDFDPATGKGTGFVFTEYTTSAFLATVRRAIDVYHDDKNWRKLVRNAMKQDFSWKGSAEKYVKLYHRIVAQKGG